MPEWIDLNASLAPAAERLTLIGGLTWLDDRSTKLHGSRFVELDESDQVSILREISDETVSLHVSRQKLTLETDGGFFQIECEDPTPFPPHRGSSTTRPRVRFVRLRGLPLDK